MRESNANQYYRQNGKSQKPDVITDCDGYRTEFVGIKHEINGNSIIKRPRYLPKQGNAGESAWR